MYDDTSHDVFIAYTSFCRRTVRTRFIYCLRQVLCFISFRTKLSTTLHFQWFLSLKCHSFSVTDKNIFVSYFTKLCKGLADKVSCFSNFVMFRKDRGFIWFCQYINQLHASFPDASVLVVVPPGESIHSGLCFVLLGSRNACRESGTEVAGKGTAWSSPMRWRHQANFITSFLRRAK